ncbi:unnamed protein product [Calypogeia fissa]
MEEGAKGVSGPGGRVVQSASVKNMNSGDGQCVTEGSESLREVAESLKQHRDAGKSGESAGMKANPKRKLTSGSRFQVSEDVAATGARKHSQVGTPRTTEIRNM